MLQHEQPSTSADVPASQRRVTPQELTKALGAIETQKEKAARRQEDEEGLPAETITLGESIEKLGLNSTPEEIWAEVQAQRTLALSAAAQEAPQEDAKAGLPASRELEFPISPARRREAPPADVSPKSLLGWALLACAGGVLSILFLNAPRTSAPRTSAPRQANTPNSWRPPFAPVIPGQAASNNPFALTAPDAEFYRKLNLSQGPQPQYQIVLYSPFGNNQMAGGRAAPGQKNYPLNAVPDGYTFYKPHFIGMSMGSGSFVPGCMFEDADAAAAGPKWRMTRYNGRYYQQSWILRKDISRLNSGRSLYLFPTPILPSSLPPDALVPLTLAVGSYPANCYAGSANNVFEPCYQDMQNQQGAASSMLLPEGKKVILDAHAWENFPAFQPQNYQPPAWTRSPKTFTDASEFDTSSQIETVQAVPSGRIIHCSGSTLQQLLHAYPYQGSISQVLVDARPQLDRPWTILKLGGRAYLRGWIADHPARPLLPGRGLVIFSGPQVPDFVNPPVQITVPLDTLTWHVMMDGSSPSPDSGGTVGKVIVSIVRLDQHAWEKW